MISLEALKVGLKSLGVSKKTAGKIIAYFENPDKIADLNSVIYQRRILSHHKGVQLLKPGERGYKELFYIHPIVEALAADYKEDYRIMADLYVALGMKKMVRGFGMTKFKYYNEDILTELNIQYTVKGDLNPGGTWKLAKYYQYKVHQIWGEVIDSVTTEDKYHLIKLKEFVQGRELVMKDWIDARFEKFSHRKHPIPVYLLYTDIEESHSLNVRDKTIKKALQ